MNILKSSSVIRLQALIILISALMVISAAPSATAQHSWNTSTETEERPFFTPHFSPDEFAERRSNVYVEIGSSALAIVQGAPMPMGFQIFRQNNEFYYLSGIFSPHAYMILDGQS